MDSIQGDGVTMEGLTQFQMATVTHFSILFQHASTTIDHALFDIVWHSISNHHNKFLCAVPSLQEIHDVIFSLKRNNPSGPDGFFGSFFPAAWHIVRVDVIKPTQQFFSSGRIFRATNIYFLTLIVKVNHPSTFQGKSSLNILII